MQDLGSLSLMFGGAGLTPSRVWTRVADLPTAPHTESSSGTLIAWGVPLCSQRGTLVSIALQTDSAGLSKEVLLKLAALLVGPQ